MNTADIKARLGIAVTGEFVAETLKVPPRERDKRAMIWSDDDFPLICDRLAAYVTERKTFDPLFG